MQHTEISASSNWLGSVIVMIQLLDIVIHAATDQLEPVRVVANLIIFAWVAIVMSGRISVKTVRMAVSAIGAYLLLNILFLATEGVTNTGGDLRSMLFLLVCLTVALSTLLTVLRRRSLQE